MGLRCRRPAPGSLPLVLDIDRWLLELRVQTDIRWDKAKVVLNCGKGWHPTAFWAMR
ncbi:hypothetical protein GCM10027072_79620 [Streptomyces bullii]